MRRALPALLVTLTLAASACGGGDSTAPVNVAGTYTLQTVNNAPLPFTTDSDATFKAEIVSWVVILNDGNSYSYVFMGRSTDNGQITENTLTSNGTYSVSGSAVDLFDPVGNVELVGDSHIAATVNGNALTIVLSGPLGVLTLRLTR